MRITFRQGRGPDQDRVSVNKTPGADQRQPFVIAPMGRDQDDPREGVPGGANDLYQQVGQHVMVDEQRPGKSGVFAAGSVRHGGGHGNVRPGAR